MSIQIKGIRIVSDAAEDPSEVLRPDAALLPRGQVAALARRLAREPLVHFLLAGTLLFGAGALFSREASPLVNKAPFMFRLPKSKG